MDMLLTGGDTELGRTIAEGFRDDGHTVVIAGARRDDLDVAAKELDVDSIVFDNTDPASLEEARSLFPHHLDAIVNVPAPRWAAGDPRAFALGDHAVAWRNALEATVAFGGADGPDPRRSPALRRLDRQRRARKPPGGQLRRRHQGRGVQLDRRAGRALRHSGHHRQRGGRGSQCRARLRRQSQARRRPSLPRSTRLALFLTTPSARHITGQTLHVSHGSLANFG